MLCRNILTHRVVAAPKSIMYVYYYFIPYTHIIVNTEPLMVGTHLKCSNCARDLLVKLQPLSKALPSRVA